MKLRYLKYILGFMLFASIVFAVFMIFDRGLMRFHYPSLEQYPVQGIDISHHQGVIDWTKVAAQKNVRFVFMKATEGGDYKDPRFSENWQAAHEAGLARGAYHFFTFCRSGKEQAQNFLSSVPVQSTMLPIAIDLEFGGNCKKEPTLDELLSELKAFVNETSSLHSSKPIFYMTSEFFERYFKGNEAQFPDHHLWLRSIFTEPAQDQCQQWSIWQFANRGSVEGIEGPVDLNVFCASEAEFAGLLQRF